MLLRVGATMMLCAIALAALVALVVNLSSPREEYASRAASVAPVENEATAQEKSVYDPGKKLEIDDEPEEKPPAEKLPAEKPPPEEPRQEKSESRPQPPREEPRVSPEPLPAPSGNRPEPPREKATTVQTPRYYQPQRSSTLALTIEKIGLRDVSVVNSSSPQALDNGVVHLPQSPMPWEQREQKNVYLAGHRVGKPGMGSHLVFYNLDKLKKGDRVELKDSLGYAYNYRVSETFVVRPDADWAVQPVRNRDMVTLQTCTLPDEKNRIIVRADRV